MEIGEHINCLASEGELLAQAAERAPLDTPVPTCPGWRLRDVLAHLGYVHRWAAGYVAGEQAEMADRHGDADLLALGPPDEEIVGWFRAGHAHLVSVLTEADPAVRCWSFLPAPSPLAFWARRQAHETAIHRVDAQLAAASAAPAAWPGSDLDPFPPGLAADGIDELLMGFASRNPARLSGTPRTLAIRATADEQAGEAGETAAGGTGIAAWTVAMGPGQPGISRGLNPPATGVPYGELTGPADALYLLLWNRGDAAAVTAAVTVAGDPAPLATWASQMRVRWN
jgi:uncharacterized protein (TIGR03083 family)